MRFGMVDAFVNKNEEQPAKTPLPPKNLHLLPNLFSVLIDELSSPPHTFLDIHSHAYIKGEGGNDT